MIVSKKALFIGASIVLASAYYSRYGVTQHAEAMPPPIHWQTCDHGKWCDTKSLATMPNVMDGAVFGLMGEGTLVKWYVFEGRPIVLTRSHPHKTYKAIQAAIQHAPVSGTFISWTEENTNQDPF